MVQNMLIHHLLYAVVAILATLHEAVGEEYMTNSSSTTRNDTFRHLGAIDLNNCVYQTVSKPIQAILCAVELEVWKIPDTSTALSEAGCLLGGKRCSSVMHVPTEKEVPRSPPPPDALNKDYQRLAMIAEKVVPQTWWRDGFDNDMLLLSHNDSELPRKQLNIRQLSNKKLRNMYQCVSRQVFIRVSLNLAETGAALATGKPVTNGKCTAMTDPVVVKFFSLWSTHKDNLGGVITNKMWFPEGDVGNNLLVSATEVLQHFYDNYGGIWTGCFRLEKSSDCRGALAAAALVATTHFIADIAGKSKSFIESKFVRGYMLASLGRGLLHGDSSATGNVPLTAWSLRTNDFTALQQAYMKLYTNSFGALYTQQLNKYIPQAFPPSFPVQVKERRWSHLAHKLEPVYTSLRNWMFTEAQALIDFSPYIPLVAFPEVRADLQSKPRSRRVLIDVGANGFFASPKYLLDSYAVHMPFTHAVMIEPEPHFSATVPQAYLDRYNITFLPIYAEVATNSDTDMLKLIPKLVTKDDFVVLKFDVDPNRYAYGPTMEWGFLFSIMGNPEIASLVDELYVELHFNFPSLFWKHYHSNWEALDAMRYLRDQGAIVHSWP